MRHFEENFHISTKTTQLFSQEQNNDQNHGFKGIGEQKSTPELNIAFLKLRKSKFRGEACLSPHPPVTPDGMLGTTGSEGGGRRAQQGRGQWKETQEKCRLPPAGGGLERPPSTTPLGWARRSLLDTQRNGGISHFVFSSFIIICIFLFHLDHQPQEGKGCVLGFCRETE